MVYEVVNNTTPTFTINSLITHNNNNEYKIQHRRRRQQNIKKYILCN